MVVRDDSYTLFYEKTIDDLDAIEAGLLEVEQASDDEVAGLVNTLFRQVHNIKGSASFYDLSEVVAITHRMETLLGMVRTKHISVDPELIAILLSAKDWLSRILDEDTSFDSSPILEQLNSFIDIKVDENRVHSAQSTGVVEVGLPDKKAIWKVSEATLMEAQNSAKGGKFIYLFVFDLIEDIEKKGKTPQEVIGEFDTLTKLIESKLDIGLVGGLSDDFESASIPLYLLCATIMDPIIVREILGVADHNVIVIKEEYISYPEELPVEVDLERSTVCQMLRKDARNMPVQLTMPYGDLQDLEKRLTLHSSWDEDRYLIQEILTAPSVESLAKEIDTLIADLAESQGKRFDHEIHFDSAEPVLNALLVFKDEFLNLVRNAVVHGIEQPHDRIHKGKSMAGKLSVRAVLTPQDLCFTVTDDGRGVSSASLSVHGDLLSQQGITLVDLSKKKCADLLLKPGLFPLGDFAQKLTKYNGCLEVEQLTQGTSVSVHISL